MKSFDQWKMPLSGIFLAIMMLVTAPGIAQFVQVGTPSGTSNTTTTYPSPFGNWYWGARQQFLYPASELAVAGLIAGDISAIQFDVTTTNGAIHNNYTISIGQTASASLTAWETGLTTVFGPVNQTPVVGDNTFTFSSPFTWDGTSNIVIEICFQNTGFSNNSVVEWTETLAYNGSRTFRADAAGVCTNTGISAGQNPDRRPITFFDGELAPCSPLTDLTPSSVSGSSADVSFAGILGDVYVEYGAPGFTPGTDANAGGGTVVGPFATSPAPLTGLSPSTEYEVYVRQDCGGGDWSVNSSFSFSTICDPYTTPYDEGFESFTSVTNATWPSEFCIVADPENTTTAYRWNPRTGTTPSNFSTGPSGAHEGSIYAFTEASSGTPGAVATLDLGPIDVSALTVPALTFYYHMRGSDMGTLNVQVSTDGASYTTEFSISGQQQANGTDPYLEALVPLPAYSGGNVYLRFEGIRGGGFNGDIAIDAISLAEAPACFAPATASVSAVGSNTVDVEWTCAGCTGDFYIEYGAPGFTPGTDENAGTGTVAGPFTTSPQQLSGLTQITEYEVVVRRDCGVDGFSTNTSAGTFTTLCDAVAAPYTEGFEAYTPPTTNATWPATECITANPENTTAAYRWNQSNAGTTSGGTGPNGPHEGSIYAFTEASSGVTGALATLDFRPIDLSALSAPVLSFYYHMFDDGFGEMGTLNVLVSTDGSTYNNEFSISGQQQTAQADPFLEAIVSLDAYAGQTVYLRFESVRGSGFRSDMAIDEVSVEEAPSCFTPTGLTVDAFTATTADISWSCGGCTGDFYVEYGAPGFTPGVDANAGGGTVVGPIAGTSTQLTGLSGDTDYAIRVRQDCGGNGFSENSSAANLYTGACNDGGPSSPNDSNVGQVDVVGLGGSGFSFDHCAPPGGPDQGFVGVQNQTALSASVAEGFGGSITVEVAACDGSTFGGAHSVWIDWNENLVFEPGEVVGSGTGNPVTNTYPITVPPGTALGPKTMRVTQQEAGALPLDPCASFTWGSVTDFSVEVVTPPACTPPAATYELLADCGNDQFSIEVDLTSVGDSPGGVVDITNDGGQPDELGVGTGIYVFGPFTAGTDVTITVEHLGDPICNTASNALGTSCVLCTAGGPSSTADSNIELVEIDGFAGSGFSHTGCPGVIGVEDLTALSVDVPNGFSYDLTVDLGTCGGNFAGAGTVWIDWNGDFEFSAAEVVGTSTVNPSSNTFTVSPPPGTPVGPKIMRVMQQEGGTLPLDPCDSFTWGSVMDFTINVIADPGCLPPDADLEVDVSSCGGTFQYFIEVTINSVGDSPGGEVTISNSFDGNTIPNATVAGSPYVYGPFPSGTNMDVNLEHLGNALCTYTTGFEYNCPPPNDDCADAIVLPLNSEGACMGAAVSATTAAASIDGPDPGACVIPGLTDVWFEFSTGSSPYISWEITLGTMEAIAVEIYDGCGGNNLYCLADETSDPNPFVELESNTTYLFRVLTLPDFEGTFDICLEAGPDSPQDNCVPEYSSTTTTLDVVGPIPGGEIITDLDLVVDLDNANVGDLLIELISPCGTVVTLQDSECDGLTSLDVQYNDGSSDTFTEFCPLGIGEVQPDQALGGFNNQPFVGTWTLSVTNATSGTAQAINSWCLVPTLDDGCPPPQIVVTDFTDNSITIDSDPGSCYDPLNYSTYDIVWNDGVSPGFENGVTFPYEITGLTPGSFYVIDAIANCTVGGSSSPSGVSQTTLNCAPSELCTYELTLENTDGTGWDGAFASVDNGWTVTDYVMDPDVSTQSWTILACPGNPITLSVSNGGNGALPNTKSISFVNSDAVEVYSENGPPESTLYSQADGCPDCSPVINIGLTRLAADLVEVNWSNVELTPNVNDIQVIVLIEDFFGSTEIANETFPAGTTSASVTLDGSYPFEDVTVQVVTNCTNEGGSVGQVLTTLPGCDAADQCEYAFNMSSTDDGWINTQLDVLLDGTISTEVLLESGTSGTQSIFACPGGTIDVSAATEAGGGIPDETCINTTQFGSATIPTSGVLTTISGCNFASEFAVVTLNAEGTYEFSSEISTDYLTFTDGSNNVIAAGPTPLEVSVPASGTYRLHINTDSNCGTQNTCRDTFGQYIGPGSAGCDSYSFALVLNPSTDDVTLVAETDFCDYDDGDEVFSAATCPTCFAPISVEVATVADVSADFEWFSNNPAGTDVTVYVGLPGFDPLVDPVSSATTTTVATGAQGPLTVSGLTPYTDYEVIIIEDCGSDPAPPSNAVPFTTLIGNNTCADATPITLEAPANCPANAVSGTTAGGATLNGDAISCIPPIPDPFVDVYYSFNSGTGNPGVLLNVILGTQTTVAIEVFDACDGNIIFCTDGTAELPAQIEVDPNTDYYVRVLSLASTTGTHDICISQIGGCTVAGSANFNPLAGVDDGSCILCPADADGPGPNGISIDMEDTFGDGWDGTVYNIYDNAVPGSPVLLFSGTLDNADVGDGSSVGTDYYCLDDGCYLFEVTGGGFPAEKVWSINNVDFGPINGTNLTTGVQFSINGGCIIDGCTDPLAINYDPAATNDDGSCIACPADATGTGLNGISIDMEDTFGDGWNGAVYNIYDASDPDNVVLLFTGNLDNADVGDGSSEGTDYYCLEDGCYRFEVTAGTFAGEISWTINGPGGVLASADSPNGAPIALGEVQFSFNFTCIIPGCTDPGAPNYNPDATEDDGSCITCDAGENLVTLNMFDSFGDGWNGAVYNIISYADFFNPVVVATGDLDNADEGDGSSLGTDYICLPDGCYEIEVTAGGFAAEVDWNMSGVDGGSIFGDGPPETVQFTINSSCPIPGCTNAGAVNFDPAATLDDGSCVFAPSNDECVNAQSLTPAQYPNTQNALGTLAGASTDGSSACIGTNGPDVFYTFNVPLENHYWVNLNPFGGFAGVVEVLDACDGTVVACENAPPSAPFCDVAQGSAGFPSDPGCEASVCAGDAFCCNNTWDGLCASDAAVNPNCTDCLSTVPAGSGPISIFIQNLPEGDYIVRIRDYFGNSYLTSAGQFLVNVQYFPFGGVQDNPNNFLYACNQGGFQLEDFVGATPQSGQGALDYQWYIYEEGGTFSNEWQRGEPNYVSRCTWLGMEYGTTYNVFTRILLNVPGEGPIWGVYPYLDSDPHAVGASSCTISTAPNVTPTELRPNYTPTNANGDLYSLCDFAVAYNVSESENFRWRFDPDTDPNNGNEIFYTRGIGNPSVRLSWVNGLLPGAIYNVAVEVMVDGQWSGYSTVLPIELALPPNNVVIRPQFCGGTYAPTGYILSESVCEADLYQFRFTPVGGGTPSFRNSGNYVCFMSAANPALTPGDYDVQVKVTQNGVPGDWGPACTITIAGPQGQGGSETPTLRDIESTSTATLFPNPNAGNEVRVELSGLGDGNHEVNVNIYDVYGKLISTDGFGHEGSQMSRLIRFDENLATGMYMVHVFVDGEQFTVERLVVK